ncbi:hypothetical protein GCM10010442_16240 [Kitasatospora kifunensis]
MSHAAVLAAEVRAWAASALPRLGRLVSKVQVVRETQRAIAAAQAGISVLVDAAAEGPLV